MKRIFGLLGMFFGFIGTLIMIPFLDRALGKPGIYIAVVTGLIIFALSIKMFRSAKPIESPALEAESREAEELTRKLRREYSFTVAAMSAVLVAVYGLLYFLDAISLTPSVTQLYNVGAGFGESVAHGQAWRLFTQMFLHASLGHLISNIFGLFAAGRLLEYVAGRKNLIAVYLSGGLLASLTSSVFNPSVVSVGASGAIFAVYGALFSSYFFNAKMRELKVPKLVWWLTGYQAFESISYGLSRSGVDNAAHIGGLVGGFVVMSIWYKLSAKNSEKAARTFVGAAGLAFVFAIAVMPFVVQKSENNPVVLSRKSEAMSEAIKTVVMTEMELRNRIEKLNTENLAEYLKWVQSDFIPKYEKVITDLRSMPTAGLNKEQIMVKDLVQESASICFETYRHLSGADRAPASLNKDETDKLTTNCTEAMKSRVSLLEKIVKGGS